MGVRIGHHGDRWIELGAWHAVMGEALRFCDADGALLFLRERLAPGDLRTLRALLAREHAMTGRLDDAAVLRQVAQRLCARTLKAALWLEPRRAAFERPEVWQQARVELPAPAPREAAPIDEPLPVVPTPAVPDDLDAAAQALTLRAAARDGVPFCAVCRRPPPARRTPPPPAATFPADSDAAAQAQTLRTAARTGVPFCEICPKRRARRH